MLEKLHFLNSRDFIASFSLLKKIGVRSLVRQSPFAPAAPAGSGVDEATMLEKARIAMASEGESICMLAEEV